MNEPDRAAIRLERLGTTFMIRISPSILSANFAELSHEIAAVSNADMLHLDVMDGHFVPNITIGLPVVESIRRATGLFLDVHLMISDPMSYAERFARAGADLVCFHYETLQNPRPVLDVIHACGKKAGIALKPSTPVSVLDPLLDALDLALIMAVEPGFGGQAFQPAALQKLAELRRMADVRKPELWIEVDGGIVPETARRCAAAGANVLVAGSYVFSHPSPETAVEELRRCGAEGNPKR